MLFEGELSCVVRESEKAKKIAKLSSLYISNIVYLIKS